MLVDPNPGPAARRRRAGRRRRSGWAATRIALVDVGGDVLAHGDEPGLASPLADAVLLAAARHLRGSGLRVVAGVFGAGCDGELTPAEVLDAHRRGRGARRLARRARARRRERSSGSRRRSPRCRPRRARWRCAARAAHTGRTTIRRGRRTVELSPVGALTFYLDPLIAMDTAARLADAVVDAPSLAATPTRSCTASACAPSSTTRSTRSALAASVPGP